MKNEFYLNGKLNYYGTTFETIPSETMKLSSYRQSFSSPVSGKFNLTKGDVFKISRPEWQDTIGYNQISGDTEYFFSSPDGFGGHNIYCNKDGKYEITIINREVTTIIYLGEQDETEFCSWELLGDLANYDNNWGKGSQRIRLKKMPSEAFDRVCSFSNFNCYCTERPVFLEEGDELKFASLNGEQWIKCAGASLLRSHAFGSHYGDNSFLDKGEDVNGHNILVTHSGKYYFYLCISKNNPENFEIVWSCV